MTDNNYYYDIFMTQLVQTLGQLTAGIISTALVVPFYAYYVKGSIFPVRSQVSPVIQVNEYDKGGDTTSDVSKGDLNVETDVDDMDGDADSESSDLEEIQ